MVNKTITLLLESVSKSYFLMLELNSIFYNRLQEAGFFTSQEALDIGFMAPDNKKGKYKA